MRTLNPPLGYYKGLVRQDGDAILNTRGTGCLNGVMSGVNPGTRECLIVCSPITLPIGVCSGVETDFTGTMTVNTNVKTRIAIFSSDGDYDSSAVFSGLPATYQGGMATGVTLSAAMTAAGSASGRKMKFVFDAPITISTPGKYWIVVIQEGIYALDTANTAAFDGGADCAHSYNHVLAGTGTCRNVAYNVASTGVFVGGINTFVWTSMNNLSSSNYTVATGPAGLFSLNGARSTSGATSLGVWFWKVRMI